jgi:hypothetical protein
VIVNDDVGAGGVPGADTVDDGNVMGIAKVNVAVALCVPLVAVTAHVPAAVAVSDEPVTRHPVLVVA